MSFDGECLFCQIVAGQLPAAQVYADDMALAFLDNRPIFPGHTLVVPRVHVETLPELPPELLAPYFAAVQRLTPAVERAMGAEGTFVGNNNRVSQSVPHLHFHIIPRRKGDGLKGFFWPRNKYENDAEAERVAAAIRTALAGTG